MRGIIIPESYYFFTRNKVLNGVIFLMIGGYGLDNGFFRVGIFENLNTKGHLSATSTLFIPLQYISCGSLVVNEAQSEPLLERARLITWLEGLLFVG